MAMIHLIMKRVFSPFIFLLLLSSHLLTRHNSCLALRYVDERDKINWDTLVDKEAFSNQKELAYLTSLDRETRGPLEVQSSHTQEDAEVRKYSQNNDGSWPADTANSRSERLLSDDNFNHSPQAQRRNDTLFLLIVGVCSVVGVLGLIAAAIFWYRIQKQTEESIESEYQSYGVTGPGTNGSKIAPNAAISDRKLAQSAQMFHYQQQRQQMMAQEKAHLDAKPVHSDDSDDEAPNGGDYTVYECPGLAPTGEMEVRNPLFAESEPSTSAAHPTTNNHYPQLPSTLPPPPTTQTTLSASSTQEKPSS